MEEIYKNKNFTKESRIYIWHRFEQAEADCQMNLKQLSIKGKRISLKLMRILKELGETCGTLTQKDILDMEEIIQSILEKHPELAESQP